MKKHISESPNTKIVAVPYSVNKNRPEGKTRLLSSVTGAGFGSHSIYPCDERCMYDPENRMRYQIHSAFGVCMIKKHQDYFTDEKIFDFSSYHDFVNNEDEKIDAESLKAFIKRSHELSDKSSHNKKEVTP